MRRRHMVLAVLLLWCGGAVAEDTKLTPFKSAGEKFGLKTGEQLTYSIHWIGLPVGTAIMRVREIAKEKGRSAYHLTTQVRSNRIIRWIYKVEDDAVSFVEVDGFRPLRFDKKLREGKRKKDEIIDFDWEKNEAVYYKIRGETEKKRRAIPLEKGAQDSLSCLYFLRAHPLTLDNECLMKVATEKKCWDLKIKPLREEKLEVDELGTFDTLVMEPIAEFDGLFIRSDKKLTIWLEKETRIPLKMVASIPVGSVTVWLKDAADTEADPGKAIDLPSSGPVVSRREIRKDRDAGATPWEEKPAGDGGKRAEAPEQKERGR